MIHFENAKRQLIELPRGLFTLVPNKKPNALSASKKKYVYKLLMLWSYTDKLELKEEYEQQLAIFTCLSWRDYKVYSQCYIEEIMSS